MPEIRLRRCSARFGGGASRPGTPSEAWAGTCSHNVAMGRNWGADRSGRAFPASGRVVSFLDGKSTADQQARNHVETGMRIRGRVRDVLALVLLAPGQCSLLYGRTVLRLGRVLIALRRFARQVLRCHQSQAFWPSSFARAVVRAPRPLCGSIGPHSPRPCIFPHGKRGFLCSRCPCHTRLVLLAPLGRALGRSGMLCHEQFRS
jgi:hypothetical protein